MANLIVISGPQAVGKMTIAESLKEKLDYSLLINHYSKDISNKIFLPKSEAQLELNNSIKNIIFEIAIKYDIDIIFTCVTRYDIKKDIEDLNHLKEIFELSGGNFYYVELYSELKERIRRNATPHRLESKPSKENIEESTCRLLEKMKNHRLNSNEDEILFPTHIKINNTNLLPEEVASKIINTFKLRGIKNRNGKYI